MICVKYLAITNRGEIMKKSRIEAFTDAVVAIIITIMVLEIKVPHNSDIRFMLNELPYYIAFTISFLFICTAWYNHHFLLAHTKWFSKRAFWANNFWLLCMAPIPVATAWVSEFPTDQGPEYFYFGCYVLWACSYYLLNWILYLENNEFESSKHHLKQSKSFRLLHHVFDGILFISGTILIYFIPILGLIITTLQVISWVVFTPKESDKIETD